jgi:hypothetical protein
MSDSFMSYKEMIARQEHFRETEKNALHQATTDFENALMWGPVSDAPTEVSEDYYVKLAWVMIDGEKKMLGVDNRTMVGYAMKETTPEWKRPLEPVHYDEFVRWCRLMDL